LLKTAKNHLVKLLSETSTGSERDFRNAVYAVIDEPLFDRIMSYIDLARSSASAEIIAGGRGDKSKRYFFEPTVIVVSDPHFSTMEEEIFGPVITIWIYDDDKYAIIQACRALRSDRRPGSSLPDSH